MTWSDGSDTHLQSTVGDGSLWLFEPPRRQGSEGFVSEASGKVENTIPIPGGLDRPILPRTPTGSGWG